MGPVLRISGRGAIRVTLSGLTSGQADVLRELVRSSGSGAGFSPAPSPFFEHPAGSSPADVVLTGTFVQLKHAISSVVTHDGIPANLSKKIDSLLDNHLRSDYKIDCRGKILDLAVRTHVMGILNVTPDSFSDGGLYANTDKALAHAHEMAAAGADIIDIGGESTRPGARPLSEEEELQQDHPGH